MLSSMTGFGRSATEGKFGKLTVEIQSINRKYLEIFVSLPKEFGRFELEIRKWVGEAIARGQVSVRVFLLPSAETLTATLPDAAILKRLKNHWEKVSKSIGTDPKAVDLPFLMQYLPTQPKQEATTDEHLPILKDCIANALQQLVKMKQTEGKALAKDIGERLKTLEKLLFQIEKHAPDATRKMKERLVEKLKEVFEPGVELDERLLREVALFAEKVDITEEITRFRSHVAQFKEVLKEGQAGRKMDFLVQEMGREINTIGSKSLEVAISRLVVEGKAELEKIREQIQNLE